MDEQKLVEISKSSILSPGKLSILPKYEGNGPTLYVFRHGETQDNFNRIFSGRRNSPLTEKGINQANILAEKLKPALIYIAYTPNLDRCQNTLNIVLKLHQNTKILIDDNLLERDYGDLTGKSKVELNEKDPVLTAKYRRAYDFPPPNGESLKEVKEKRIWPFCLALEEKIRLEKVNVAVCCTNNTMRLIRMYFEKLSIEEMESLENPLAQDYCSYRV